ncbi:MAG: hypothetical protein KDC85_23585, partial [Saprospiraceae bacterium]|nr:hypothetical protein [Saprospiraceae bacterium]
TPLGLSLFLGADIGFHPMLLRIKSLRDCFAGKKFRLILRRYSQDTHHSSMALQHYSIMAS